MRVHTRQRIIIGLAAVLAATTPGVGADQARAAGQPATSQTTTSQTTAAQAGAGQPVPVPLGAYYNNNGIGTAAGDANVDGSGYAFPASALPSGAVAVDSVPYDFPTTTAPAQTDNVVALGQTLAVPSGAYLAGYVLATSTYGAAGGSATVHYADNSTTTATLSAPDWYSGSGAVSAPYRYSPGGTDQHAVSIYVAQVWLDPGRQATSITLPTTATPAANQASLHIFALTLQPVIQGYAVRLDSAASTTKQIALAGGSHAQVVQASVTNLGTQWITPAAPLTVRVNADGVRTVRAARISQLAPGEQARVEIGITSPGLPAGLPVDGTIQVSGPAAGIDVSRALSFTAGIPAYTANDDSLTQHQSPDWFNDAKFGIFIHWGIYSVPAWAPVGKQYAEWYWNDMNNPNNPTYAYHAQTYGKAANYDDFIPQFTAAKYDPRAWVRLFNEAGAKYFVLTAKHHEGFSLYDTSYSDRNSVKLGPHQDLVAELFAASREYTPQLHPGVYYSLPEWFNPANPWNGHGPQNPYTGAPVPYTGYRPVTNYVTDFQAPQMKELIAKYQPDILWCDIGAPATDRTVLQKLFNQELVTGRPKTVDNRCGLPAADFNTPEYASSFSLQTSKFEATRGVDPFSFGYNAATPDGAYATSDQLVQQLVDIVSKNGNLLLDIGPRADGTIPDIMQTRLREIGAWLAANGEAIYGTTYWSKGATDGDLRFTVKPDEAFYITSLTRPGSQVVVNAPVPIRPGNKITMLGYSGRPLHWARNAAGQLVIDVPAAAQQSGQHAWVFKVDWKS
jgi:alpha-L-fucosidase